MRLLAIDPGPEESALLIYDTTLIHNTTGKLAEGVPVEWEKCRNGTALSHIERWRSDALAVEMVASYGMPVGAEVFETCVMAGRFIERWLVDCAHDAPAYVYRREVKLHICNSAKAKDANVRQALIDRYGGKEKAIGKKATPGPLYGISGDCWAALGVAITAAER